MAKSYIAASNIGLSSIDALKDKASRYNMFNAEDWNSFSLRGELDNYLQILDEFNKQVDFNEFQKKYNYALDDLSSQSRIVAMMNELSGDRTMKEVQPGIISSDYEEVSNVIRNEIALNQSERYASMQEQIISLQSGWSDFENAMKAIPHKLSTSVLNFVGDLQRGITGIANVEETLINPAKYNEFAARAGAKAGPAGSNQPISPVDVLGAAYNAAFEDVTWDLEATAGIDKFFNYKGWEYASGFAKYTASLSDSIGRILPTLLMTVTGSKLGALGDKLVAKGGVTLGSVVGSEAMSVIGTGLAGTSQASYYLSMQASNYRELMENPNLCTRPTFELVANSAIRAGFELGVEKLLDLGFGTSAVDSMVYGYTQSAQKSITKGLTKAAIKRIGIDALHEGLEEVLQDFSGNFTNLLFGAIDENYLDTCDWSMQAMFDAFIMGALMSVGGSMLRVIKPLVFKNERSYSNEFVVDKDGNLILDKDGKAQFKKLNLFANYEYNLTLESFMETFADFSENYDSLSDSEKSDLTADMMQMFKTITSVFGEFGTERFNKAQEILNKLQHESERLKTIESQEFKTEGFKSKLLAVGEEVYAKRFTELMESMVDVASDAQIDAVKHAKPEILKQLIQAKTGPISAILTQKMTIDEIRNLSGEASTKTVKAFLDGGYDTVIITDTGTNIVYIDALNAVVIPKQLVEGFTPETNVRTTVEQEIARNMASSKEFVSLTGEIVRRYQAFVGDKNATSEQAFLAMLYNEQFQQVLLYSGDKTLIKLIDSLTALYEASNKKGIAKDILKQQIDIIKNNIGKILFQYYLDQPNIDKAYINSSKTLTADQKRKLINMTWQKNIYSKIFNDDSYMPSTEDLTVLDRQIDNAKYHEDGETWQDSVRTMIHSKKHSLVVKGLKELNAYYKNIYSGRFNGLIYMPYDGNVANATFNAFCFAYGISIPELHSTNGLSVDDIDNIKTMYNDVNERTIFNYWNNTFINEYGYQFKETKTKDGITLTITEAAPLREQRGNVTRDQYKGFVNKSNDPNRVVGNYVIGPSKAVSKSLLSDKVSPVERSIITVDDIIKDPSLLSSSVQEEIKKASNGRLDTSAVYLYLRKKYFDDSNGKSTIVISEDGSSYYVATIEDTSAVMKDSFEKTGFAELQDAKSKLGGNVKEVELDPRDFVSKKTAKMFELEDGTSVLPRIVVTPMGSTSVAADYDALTNVITVNSDFADFDAAHMYYYIAHEFRHAIQSHNGEAIGFDDSWLSTQYARAITPKAKAKIEAIVADIKAHYPDLFAKLKKGASEMDFSSDLIYTLSSGESGAYGYDMDASFYPFVVKLDEYGQVDSIMTPWGSVYSSKGVTYAKQKVTSQAVQRETSVTVDTKKTYSNNEDAQGTNLKYYIREADVEANKQLRKEGKLPTAQTVGMPIKNIVPNVRLRQLIVATTGRESNFDPMFIDDIKNARLRTNSDVISYLHAIDNAKYESSLKSGTKYARQVDYTLSAIAYYYYGNKYFAKDPANVRAAIEMSYSADAARLYATAKITKEFAELDDDVELHRQVATFWEQPKSWSKTLTLTKLLQQQESSDFKSAIDTLTTERNPDGSKIELDIDYSSLVQAMLKSYDGTLSSLYKILSAKRKGALERSQRAVSIEENLTSNESADGSKGDTSRMGIDAAQYGLDPENNSMDRIEYVRLSLIAQRTRTNEEWLATNDNKKLRAIERKIDDDVTEEIDSWTLEKIDMIYYAITQSENTEAAIDRINSMDENTNKITEYRALRRNIVDRTRRYVNSQLSKMTKAEIAEFVAHNPGLGISKDGTFSVPSGYSDSSIAAEVVKGMTLKELKSMYNDYLAGFKTKQEAKVQTIYFNQMLGDNPTRGNYEQVALSIVANMSKEAMSKFNADHKAEVAELRKKYASKIGRIGSTASLDAAQAIARQAQDFETDVRTAFADWTTRKQTVTQADRNERNLLRRSNEAKQRKIERYQEQVDSLVAKVKEKTAELKEARRNQNVQTVTANITTDGKVEAPDVIKHVLEPVYNRVRKTYTSVANTDEVHFEQSWNDFLQDFDSDLEKIKASDVDNILNFVANASINIDQDPDAVRSFYATRQFLLMYLYKQHYDPNSDLTLTEEQLDRTNRMFGTIAGVAGTNLRISAIADKLLTPESVKLKERASRLGIDFDESDLNELDLITQHDYTIDILKQTGGTSVTSEIRKQADELKMSKLIELQERMFEKASKKYKGKKKQWLDKVWEWERMAMLSSPGTWVRNALSNVLVEKTNKISATIGNAVFNVIDKIKGGKLKAKVPTDQYQIATTKPTSEVTDFVNNTVIGSGFMDLIGESMAKQDADAFSNKSDSANDIVSAMIRRNIIGKVLKDNRFTGNNKVTATVADLGNWINGLLYGKTKKIKNSDGTVTVKQTNGLLSDNKWVDKTFKYYLERMLTEDVAAGRIKLEQGLNNKATLEVITNAYVQAAFDYMHKTNFFSDIEDKLREKAGPAGYFIYKQFSPFAAASWNWFVKALDYTPIGLAKAIVDMHKLDQRIADIAERRLPESGRGEILPTERLTSYNIKRKLGSGIVGTIGFGVGILLASLGVAGIDDDDDKLKLFVGPVSVSIDDVFGTSGVMMGLALASQIRKSTANQEDFMSTMWKALSASLNTAFDDSIFSDVLDMMQGSRTFVDILANKAVDTFFGAFVPNMFWTFLNYMTPVKTDYAGGLVGYLERMLVKTLPPLAWALPKRRDPYTGELQYKYNMPWADGVGGIAGSVAAAISNWLLPVKVYNRNVSDAEAISASLGVAKGELTGNYNDIGKLNTIEQDKLNEYYGGLNNTALNDFISDSVKYTVENESGKRVELTYSKMTDAQRATTIKKIMNENAKYAKIYIATTIKGYKYYTRSKTEYEQLKKLGLTNIYLSAKPIVENFVK